MSFPFDANDAPPPANRDTVSPLPARPRAAKVAALRQATEAVASPVTTAPVDRGERLATLPRGDSEEVRVSWDSYNGYPYLSIRLWARNAAGAWWPDPKRGITIKPREPADFAGAVDAALERAAG